MSDKPEDLSKAKFLEALEKKKQSQSRGKKNTSGGSKLSGGEAAGKKPKMFRRKSGSA